MTIDPKKALSNPFRPGAGHMPPYLAGREAETKELRNLLRQETILDNMVLTGLRGVGKTVLLETFKPIAIQEKWFWIGTDISESVSIKEENIAVRLMTDLAVVLSNVVASTKEIKRVGFTSFPEKRNKTLNYDTLAGFYMGTPGLVSDKLKATMEFIWECLKPYTVKRIVFAYDEAQNLSDYPDKEQYPLSLLLDVFQSIQRKGIPFMLILTGLPTLFPNLVDARTFAERMFHVVFLDRLNKKDSQDAILKPIEDIGCPIKLNKKSVDEIIRISNGYPYFIQFICREVYDIFIQKADAGQKPSVPVDDIIRKLDTDFFAGRWSKATDRQRELLILISQLDNCDTEFTVQEIVNISKERSEKPFSNSHVNQMLSTLCNAGLVYKNRHGKYSFAVPQLGLYILRQSSEILK